MQQIRARYAKLFALSMLVFGVATPIWADDFKQWRSPSFANKPVVDQLTTDPVADLIVDVSPQVEENSAQSELISPQDRLIEARGRRQAIVQLLLWEAAQLKYEPCGKATACYNRIQHYRRKIEAIDKVIASLDPDAPTLRYGIDGWIDPRDEPDGTLQQYDGDIERQLLYERLMAMRLEQAAPNQEKLDVTLTMGVPAAGKSTALNLLNLCQEDSGIVVINADDYKADFVEYQVAIAARDRLAASRVHEESSLLAKRTRNMAIQTRRDFCLDGTLSNRAEALQLIDILQRRDYEVTVIGVLVPYAVAAERVVSRAERTGRFVPLSVVRDAYEKISQHAETVVKAANIGYLYDTNVEYGDPPNPVAHYQNGKVLFRDDVFLSKLRSGEL